MMTSSATCHNLSVFPIVLYLAPGTGGLVTERYNEAVLGRTTVNFEYAAVGLPDLQAEDYEAYRDPFASALASLMRSRARNRARRKFNKLLQIASAQYDESRQALLAVIVHNYLNLDPAASAEFERYMAEEAGKKVTTLITPWEERGIQKGLQQGLQQGLLRLLQAKFGPVPDVVTTEVSAISAPEQLEALMLRVLTANSLDEMGFTSAVAA